MFFRVSEELQPGASQCFRFKAPPSPFQGLLPVSISSPQRQRRCSASEDPKLQVPPKAAKNPQSPSIPKPETLSTLDPKPLNPNP